MPKTNDVPFAQAAEIVGLDTVGLKLEGFRTDGTSNYLANLNFRGQTWAGALRLPAKGADLEEFLAEKAQALDVVAYLLGILRDGIDVGADCELKFGGVSAFSGNSSTKEFLRCQSQQAPLELNDKITGRTKLFQGIPYPECIADESQEYIHSYAGPFYLSRGAPAWETLEEYPDLWAPTARGLAALHLRTGEGRPIDEKRAAHALSTIVEDLLAEADGWAPDEGSKEAAALNKSMKKWGGEADQARQRLIRRERFIRTAAGRRSYKELFARDVVAHASEGDLAAFCHGDSHGGNFILVRYEYKWVGTEVLVDRVFLNEIFQQEGTLMEVEVFLDAAQSRLTFDRPGCAAALGPTGRVIRHLHHEIHPIDLDAGTGMTPDTKTLHLFDAFIFAISMQNITALFSAETPVASVLSAYYEGLKN